MEIAEYANIFENENAHFYYVGTHNAVIKFLEAYLPKRTGNTILDAGCGTGALMKKLKKFGKVYGIDVSDEALKFTKLNNLKQVKKAGVENIPYQGNQFDAVISIDVLYHRQVKSDLRALREFRRVLKSGGILIVKNPAHNWLRGSHDVVIHTKRRYSKNEFNKKLEKVEFQIIKSSYINIFFLPLAVIKRLLESVLKSKRSFSSSRPASDVQGVPPLINKMLINLYGVETDWFLKSTIPFGLSLFSIAKKPTI